MTDLNGRPAENVAVSNRFGTVTNLAVHYNVKKSLFAGTRREDLTMRHVVSAQLETSRHTLLGAGLALLGIRFLIPTGYGGGAAPFLTAVVLLALAVFLLWGSPRVQVTAADGRARPSVSWPWTRDEARNFVDAVSRELMNRG